ncbi:hypothetical protein WN944_029688 [Citrus x changshan-huyou]|uniref:Reverse transcriptase domain-containing protein n=1 Tax=Citrus x changshan-huyou TaxID=2935761 RepID=A0AAP0LH97_9ROSI
MPSAHIGASGATSRAMSAATLLLHQETQPNSNASWLWMKLECKQQMASLRGRLDVDGKAAFTEARNRYNELLHSHERNSFGALRNSQGQWISNSSKIDVEIVEYFRNLFKSDGYNTVEFYVKEALFEMHPDKSPGPDGMNPAFYQTFWHNIGKDVVSACLSFIHSCSFPVGLNDISIVLIPKKQRPEVLSDIRPIALCNVLYKIVSKNLANRIKSVLDSVISKSQSAFVPGRAITDNTIVSAEIMHFLKKKRQGKHGVATLKIDMSKAYDKIEWDFLQDMMLKLGFDAKWVHLIMLCDNSSLCVNREDKEVGQIMSSRGLRQGHPLSLYFFILCAWGLSSLIKRHERLCLLHGVRVVGVLQWCLICSSPMIASYFLEQIRLKLQQLSRFWLLMEEHRIMLSEKKNSIAKESIDFLGMVIKDGHYQPGPHIATELLKFPDTHLNKKQIQQFIGIVNYVHDFIAKVIAQSPLPLRIPTTGHRILQTDASDDYWSDILLEEINGVRHFCAHASGQFKDFEKNYHVIYKEILAVKYGIKKFEFHLINHKFLINMDNSTFPRIFDLKNKLLPDKQLLSLKNWFAKYDFTVQHIKGKQNLIPDFFTRLPINKPSLISSIHTILVIAMNRQLPFKALNQRTFPMNIHFHSAY